MRDSGTLPNLLKIKNSFEVYLSLTLMRVKLVLNISNRKAFKRQLYCFSMWYPKYGEKILASHSLSGMDGIFYSPYFPMIVDIISVIDRWISRMAY